MKTPKEKAKKLVDKFYKILTKGFSDNDYAQILADAMWYDEAKQCALICVDEKIETLLNIIGTLPYMYSEYELELHRDLQELKKEILKL